MKEKDIISMIKNEGENLSPSSFSAIKKEIMLSDKYLENKIKLESESFIPNNINPILNEIKKNEKVLQPVKPVNKKKSWIWALSGVLSGACAAVVIPVAIIFGPKNEINTVQTSAASVKLVLSGENITKSGLSTRQDDNIVIDYNLDNDTCTIPDSYFTCDRISSMLLALANNNQIVENSSFIKDIVSVSKNKNFINEATVNVKVYIYDCNDADYKADALLNIEKKLNNSFNYVSLSSYSNLSKEEIREMKINDLKDLANALIHVDGDPTKPLYYNPNGPQADINDPYTITPYEEDPSVYDTMSDEYLDMILNNFKQTYAALQTRDRIVHFQNDLLRFYDIYSKRKNSLISLLDLAIEKGATIDVNEIIDNLPSSSWWDNDFIFDDFDNELINFICWNDSFKRIDEMPPEAKLRETLTKGDFQKEDLENIVNEIKDVLLINEKWFSFVIKLLPDATKIKDKDNNHFWEENAQDYWEENEQYWNNYWKDEYKEEEFVPGRDHRGF